jgi:[acyl-carrier-protein] S-malonyltransferase
MSQVVMFPGQGSQKVGMGADVYEKFPLARDRFDAAGTIAGFDLKKMCFEGPQEALTATQHTQPSLFTLESILFDLCKEKGLCPEAVLGHSLGEYGALYAAGVFSFEDGLALVTERGRLMAKAGESSKGAMSAVIGLSAEKIREVLATVTEGVVVPANENSPDQVVISGSQEGVAAAAPKLSAAGAKRVLPLPVSGAFHSPLMQPAADQFASFLTKFTFKNAVCPVIANVDGCEHTDGAEIRDLLVKQLVSPVKWVDSIAHLKAKGLTSCLELGPGSVLAGLVKKCSAEINVVSCGTVDNLYSLPIFS